MQAQAAPACWLADGRESRLEIARSPLMAACCWSCLLEAAAAWSTVCPWESCFPLFTLHAPHYTLHPPTCTHLRPGLRAEGCLSASELPYDLCFTTWPPGIGHATCRRRLHTALKRLHLAPRPRQRPLHARQRLSVSATKVFPIQPAMLNARGIVTQYRKLLRVHTKLIYRYAQDLRKRTPLARQPQWVYKHRIFTN
jgi:hypothetical protein